MKKMHGFMVMAVFVVVLGFTSVALTGCDYVNELLGSMGLGGGDNGTKVPGSPPDPLTLDAYMTLYIQTTGTGNGESPETPLPTVGAALEKVAEAYTVDPAWQVTEGTKSPAEIIVLDTIPAASGAVSGAEDGPPIILRYVPKEEQDKAETAGSPIEKDYPLITVDAGVKLTLQNIILKGVLGNKGSLVKVTGSGAELVLETGAVITGNTVRYTGFVYGGGVYVSDGTLTMKDGTISGNIDGYGGGVGVYGGRFTMEGGTISGNIGSTSSGLSNAYGGGVFLHNNALFTMSGGTISGNHAYLGGGVYVVSGSFTKTGGIIYGSMKPDGTEENRTDADGKAVKNTGSQGGPAVWVTTGKLGRNKTAETDVDLHYPLIGGQTDSNWEESE